MNDELREFRSTLRQFVQKELLPCQERWRAQHRADPGAWREAGRIGMLVPDLPRAYGGGGGTFAHQAVVLEELARAGIHFGCRLQSIVGHYVLAYGTEEQKRLWLPRMARGELVAALAITEPGAGSDVQAIATSARRDGEHYVVNGGKSFISNGSQAGLLCLAVKTDPKAAGPKGISLLIVETEGLAGYQTGRPLEKLGMAQLPYERLTVGVSAVAAAETAVAITTSYVKQRAAFGRPLIEFQNTRFTLAECRTEAHVGRVFLDGCIERALAGRLDAVSAAMAKYWLTECQWRIVDACLQLHGGYGYVTEYPIARLWADGRVQRIYAGANEVLKEVIGCSL